MVLRNTLKNTKIVAIVTSVALLTEELTTQNEPSTLYVLVVNGDLVKGSGSHSEADILAAANSYIAGEGGQESGWKVLPLY